MKGWNNGNFSYFSLYKCKCPKNGQSRGSVSKMFTRSTFKQLKSCYNLAGRGTWNRSTTSGAEGLCSLRWFPQRNGWFSPTYFGWKVGFNVHRFYVQKWNVRDLSAVETHLFCWSKDLRMLRVAGDRLDFCMPCHVKIVEKYPWYPWSLGFWDLPVTDLHFNDAMWDNLPSILFRCFGSSKHTYLNQRVVVLLT